MPGPSSEVQRHDLGGGEAGAASFTTFVTAVTAAFGDPTRREIFLRLRDQPGMTVTELADAFSLHPNAARHHLDRLVAGGYVTAEVAPRTGEVGRPAKRYRTVSDDLGLEEVARRDNLVVRLLQRALEVIGPDQAEAMAFEVGEGYGRELAASMGPVEGQRSVRTAMETVASAMTAHGFAAHAETDAASVSVVSATCPFGNAAVHQPVLCAVERGMVSGLMAGLVGTEHVTPVSFSSKARGDEACRTAV